PRPCRVRTSVMKAERMIVAAVPVKDFDNAKQRLMPALGAAERAALATAMLEDVLAALAAARLDCVWVVTREAAVVALARAGAAEAAHAAAARPGRAPVRHHARPRARARARAARAAAAWPRPRRRRAGGSRDAPRHAGRHRQRAPRRLVAGRRTAAAGRHPASVLSVRYEVIGVAGIGEVRPGDDVAALVIAAAARQSTPLQRGD